MVEDWGRLWGPVEWEEVGMNFRPGKVSQLHSLSIVPNIGPGLLICWAGWVETN